MKRFMFITALALSTQVGAIDVDLDLAQSSPSHKWFSIENDVVRVIYPEEVKSESVYIANLVEHYSHVVGKTYGIEKPRQFNLIIRPEMALSNAYVTLAPRRSEWFTSSTYFPYVSSSEWFQTLSIHEYRHVNQFDHFNREMTHVLYYVMGEAGWQLAAALGMPSWYLEGDAVWAETKYTDAGRGRSPRFSSRLKALVLSDKLPTFDQFVNGSYKTELPNQYVYGYALISYGYQKYGEDFWSKVTEQVSKFPYPLSFYTAFGFVSEQKFEDFYAEAMADLKKKWSSDKLAESKWQEFREDSTPIKTEDGLYYVKKTLDTHPQLIREANGKSEVVHEFPFNKELQIIDIKGNKLVYTQFLPDARYAHKGSSDLYLVNLKNKKSNKITDGKRIYNPRFNASGTKIIAAEFKADQSWNISEFDLNGKTLNQFSLPEGKVAEVFYMDEENAVALINSKTGTKLIASVDLKNRKMTNTLVNPSRNLLHSLYVDKNKNIFFEAQYKGSNEIFQIAHDGKFTICTTSKLGAYTPSSDGENLYVSIEDTNGSLIKSSPVNKCKEIAQNDIVDFNYLGTTPSDNYNNFTIQNFADQEQLAVKNTQQYQPKEYGGFDSSLFIPHSWGLTLGRGTGLGAKTDNYLHTMSLAGIIGTDPEEGKSFAELSFDIRKYYPLIRFQVETREREVTDYGTQSKAEWTENAAGVATVIPYIKKSGLYNFAATLSLQGSYLDTSEYKFNEVAVNNSGSHLIKTGAGVGFKWSEDLAARSIQAPWLLSYSVDYENADAPSNSLYSSYRASQRAQINTPGFFKHNGFMFTMDDQKQRPSFSSYRFLPNTTTGDYTFSRGYNYEDVPYFQKLTANYLFPLAYPDYNLSRYYYLRRIYSNVFFDTTKIEKLSGNKTLNSYGIEFLFESQLLRFLPINIGTRFVEKMDTNKFKAEFFLASDIGF